MPLKIRCPHCLRVLVAADETAGQTKLCPACGQNFNVPLPSELMAQKPAAAQSNVPTCPRCHAEVAPTAVWCHQCHTNLATGKRLPLRQRLRFLTWRFWTIAGASVAVGVLVLFAVLHMVRIQRQPPPAPFVPTAPKEIAGAELAAQLFAARTSADREAALCALSGVEQRAAPAVADALAAALDKYTDAPQARANVRAALDLLVRTRDAHLSARADWLALLERCQQQGGLRATALRARAQLGDERVAADLADLWLSELQRSLLLARVAGAARSNDEPGTRLGLRQATTDLSRTTAGLRILAQNEPLGVFERLLASYWESWSWLGQQRGERLADAIFDLARPAQQSLNFDPRDVRQPRDILKRIGASAAAPVRAAAGLVLEQRGPQYRSACHTIAESLAQLLPTCDPHDQQRLTWAIARLRGKLFGEAGRADPLDVTPAEIAAAAEWGQPGSKPTLKGPYPAAPVLKWRAVPATRLLERDLLAQLHGGWPAARRTLDDWLAAELGCTPRIAALVSPGQRDPDYPAVTMALVIAATSNAQALRPQLELWHEATEQPAWLRALAYTVLGSLDARTGKWTSGWPAGLDPGDVTTLDSGDPGWEPFGRVLVAGGPGMLERAADFKPAPLPTRLRDRLLAAAKAANRAAP